MCSLKEAEEDGLVPQFRFVEINGMRMTDPYQTYPLIWKVCVSGVCVCVCERNKQCVVVNIILHLMRFFRQQLKGEQVSADNATSLLDEYFSRRQQRDKSRPTVVLLADEVCRPSDP